MGFRDFIYNDRTIQQLKNAGNMRLIRSLAQKRISPRMTLKVRGLHNKMEYLVE